MSVHSRFYPGCLAEELEHYIVPLGHALFVAQEKAPIDLTWYKYRVYNCYLFETVRTVWKPSTGSVIYAARSWRSWSVTMSLAVSPCDGCVTTCPR